MMQIIPPGQFDFPIIKVFLKSVEAYLFDIGVTLCIIATIVAGIMRLLSFGSQSRKSMSEAVLSAAIFGFIIILLASPLMHMLEHAFGTPHP